jgi:5-methylcytosine-specific restriction endonuclease McrA
MRYLAYEGFDINVKLTCAQREDWVIFKQDDFYSCAYCGKKDGTVVIHHIYGRRYKSLEWHPLNRLPLCAFHHTENPEFSAHKTDKKFKEWLKSKYYGRCEALSQLAHRR